MAAPLDGFRARSPRSAGVIGWALWSGTLGLALWCLPPGLPVGSDRTLLATLGLIGAWRWSWAALHLVRSLIYRWIVFPPIRRDATMSPPPPAIGVLVTSYRMPADLNTAVYHALFSEVARYGVPAVITAAITDPADAHLITWLFQSREMPPGSVLFCIPQDGTGKRSAMAACLRKIAAHGLPPGAAVVLMDGDTILTPGAIERSAAVLRVRPALGAVTTDNVALVKGHALTREWYRLRLAHRDSLMCSMSLSKRVLVLTGRFSVFRAELALTADFIAAVATDSVRSRRHGEIRMLTGDDKSTWFVLLRHGWRMLYLPDVAVLNVEELPHGSFFVSAVQLMLRWYGNMTRNNGRAIALGPRRVGVFFWLCLLDQRISPWTSLVGFTTMALSCSFGTVDPFFYYVAWVLVTRLIVSGIYFVTTGRFHPLFPCILYFHQIVGAWIKIYMFFHPGRQKWTRQKTGGTARPGVWAANLRLGVSVGVFALTVGWATGLLEKPQRRPPPGGVAALVQGVAGKSRTVNLRNSTN